MTSTQHGLCNLSIVAALAVPHQPLVSVAALLLGTMAGASAPDYDKALGIRHRGPTHSVAALAALFALHLFALQPLYSIDFAGTLIEDWVLGFIVSYGLHILMDCMTIQGCELAWPLSGEQFHLMFPSLRLSYDSMASWLVCGVIIVWCGLVVISYLTGLPNAVGLLTAMM